MDKDIQILLIPDVHGRYFWKGPVKETLENTNAKIVFLGDYLDVYLREFVKIKVSKECILYIEKGDIL